MVYAPPIGDKTKHCELVRWHCEDGVEVKPGDHIATLETKKVVNEIEADIAGTLKHAVSEGDTVAIGSHIAFIEHDGLSKVDNLLFLTMEICEDDLAAMDKKRGELSRDEYALQCLRQKLAGQGCAHQSTTHPESKFSDEY